MRKFIISLTAVFFAGSIIAADSKNLAQRKQLAEKLLVHMEVPQSMTKTFNMVSQMQANQMSKMGLNQAQKAKAVKVQQETMALIRKELSWNKIKSSIIEAYAETFSLNDLKALNAFYSSPAGKKFVKKQPELQRRMMMMQMTLMQKIMPQLKAIVEKHRAK